MVICFFFLSVDRTVGQCSTRPFQCLRAKMPNKAQWREPRIGNRGLGDRIGQWVVAPDLLFYYVSCESNSLLEPHFAHDHSCLPHRVIMNFKEDNVLIKNTVKNYELPYKCEISLLQFNEQLISYLSSALQDGSSAGVVIPLLAPDLSLISSHVQINSC